MKYKFIIFDFDGTLFDSRIGIVDSVKYALDELKIEHPSKEVLTSFIGPPLHYSFQKHFGLSKMDTEYAVVKLREYYSDKGQLLSEPYRGIKELLEELNKQKKVVGIATAKPTKFATDILLGNLWSRYFCSVRGSDMKGELFPKEKTIGQVMQDFGALGEGEFIMIGDTIYDIKGAQEHGIHSIAIDYGYGKRQDLKDVRPTYFVEKVSELYNILLS